MTNWEQAYSTPSYFKTWDDRVTKFNLKIIVRGTNRLHATIVRSSRKRTRSTILVVIPSSIPSSYPFRISKREGKNNLGYSFWNQLLPRNRNEIQRMKTGQLTEEITTNFLTFPSPRTGKKAGWWNTDGLNRSRTVSNVRKKNDWEQEEMSSIFFFFFFFLFPLSHL